MSKEQAVKFLNLLESDSEAQEKFREKGPEEAIAYAKSLHFDLTAEELEEAAVEIRRQRVHKNMPGKLQEQELDLVTGGEHEVGPEGHDLGCFLYFYDYDFQMKYMIFCNKNDLCFHHFYVCTFTPNKPLHPYMDS
ncbi:MAG: Nif11-like leader peptide family natural product precursor [Lachnospiraceae bacterium]|nr:Nif11-like leader peptide family natural product precursor [Solobacterium sp.]MBR3308840.1 Nif11-like leader peptide family natural product precursor [Lachnospiraceae bacterium]